MSDPADPRLTDFRDLTDADVRPDRRGMVIAEGTNVVARLAGSRYPMRAVVGVADRLEALRAALTGQDVPAYLVDKWVLSEVVGFRVTRGVLASADRPPSPGVAELLAGARRLAILERLNDFENLGALFRNAAAFGVEAVLLDPRCADPLYRRSVRVSMGHVLQVPFAVSDGPWPASLAAVRDAGFACWRSPPQRTRSSCAASFRRRAGPCYWVPRARDSARRRWPPPTGGCASRWHPASTRSTWPPPPRSPSHT